MSVSLAAVVRATIAAHGRIDVDRLADDDDLYAHGLTSHTSIDVMLALEDRFDVEFPEDLLRRSTFASVAAICAAVASLGVTAEVAP